MRMDLNELVSRRRMLGGLAASAAVLVAPSIVSAEQEAVPAAFLSETSWPNFRNGADLRGISRSSLPEDIDLLWEVRTPDGCRSTPAIADGKAYVGTLSGHLLCLDLSTGEEQWRYQSATPSKPGAFIPGFGNPISLTQTTVLAGDEDGILHAVNRQAGTVEWKFDSGGDLVGGATVTGERIIVGSHSQLLYALHLQTGEKQWEFDAKGPVNGTQAIIGKHTFVTGCSEPIMYVVDIETGLESTQIALEDLLIATPAVAGDCLYFGTSEGLVLAVDWKTQKVKWRFEMNQRREVHSAPAVTEDAVVICGRDKSLYCLDRETGKERWKFSTRAQNDNSPVIVGDRVFFGSGDKYLYAVDLKTGKELWKYNATQSFSSSSPIVADEKLLVCTDQSNGRILCFGKK